MLEQVYKQTEEARQHQSSYLGREFWNVLTDCKSSKICSSNDALWNFFGKKKKNHANVKARSLRHIHGLVWGPNGDQSGTPQVPGLLSTAWQVYMITPFWRRGNWDWQTLYSLLKSSYLKNWECGIQAQVSQALDNLCPVSKSSASWVTCQEYILPHFLWHMPSFHQSSHNLQQATDTFKSVSLPDPQKLCLHYGDWIKVTGLRSTSSFQTSMPIPNPRR